MKPARNPGQPSKIRSVRPQPGIGVQERGYLSADARSTSPTPVESTPASPSSTSTQSSNESKLERLAAKVEHWKSNLPDFCAQALTIQTKAGTLVPFQLNRAQLYLHNRLEEQLATTGMVRAVVVKGRQQGVSTYAQARFYWRTSLARGKRAYILTHRSDATDNLFAIAERFYNNSPIRPKLGACNAKQLHFPGIDSGYQVATAGAAGTGRSGTAQLFHGSEVAYWPFADTHLAGIGQVIARIPGTEIVLESTGNGLANVFHSLWVAAESGQSDYIPVFIPWFWEDGYRIAPVPEGFELDEAERDYAAAYNLDLEQMAWRRSKIASDFRGDANRFAAEYPATPAEAFQGVGVEAWIPPALVVGARGRQIPPQETGLVVGVDPARFGADETAIARRRGRKSYPIEGIQKKDTMAIAGRCVIVIREEKPLRMFIDVGGLGAGIYDRLVELGYGDVVTAINFGGTPNRPERYYNRRAEMWGEMKEWLPLGNLPQDDKLCGELSGPSYRYDSEGRLKLESKEDMLKRGVPSPNRADALGLTFAMPVAHLADAAPGGSAWEDMVDSMNRAAENDILGVNTG